MKRQSLTKTRFDLKWKGILRNSLCNLVENTISQKVSAQNKRKLSKQQNGQKLKWGNKRDKKQHHWWSSFEVGKKVTTSQNKRHKQTTPNFLKTVDDRLGGEDTINIKS